MSKRIVFMGTPEFAVESLASLISAGVDIASVVTVPDKKAGRGQQVQSSAVKKYAESKSLEIIQPIDLMDEKFLLQLRELNADIFVVVAFRKLPPEVWKMPKMGTINLHASLLPDYRGAAPINRAVINGEKMTGATTFFIEEEIDAGRIIDSVAIPIGDDENAGSVHDRLKVAGANLLVSTVQHIFDGTSRSVEQNYSAGRKTAPKIFRQDCQINWHQNPDVIFNFIRGLSPYPAAWTNLRIGKQIRTLKIFAATKVADHGNHCGRLVPADGELKIGCADGWIFPTEVQPDGKKRMNISEFLRGTNITGASIE